MIARMSKYDLVLYAGQAEDFVERLRALGLVDITTSSWEASEEDRELLQMIESYQRGVEVLKRHTAEGKPYHSGTEAFDAYTAAAQQATKLSADIEKLEKTAEEVKPWGDFDPAKLQKLVDDGIELRFYVSSKGTPAVLLPDEEPADDFQEVRMPTMSYRQVEKQIAEARHELQSLDAVFARAAASLPAIETHLAELKEQLQQLQIQQSATPAADGSLLVLEGWAEESTSTKVDALLTEYPDVIHFKSTPTPTDDVPVKLHNRPFAQLFELIGNMYAAPKYGTIDLTRFFAPFYMVFFGFCLAEGGYGLLIMLLGLFAVVKFKDKPAIRQIGWLSALCGFSGMVFGLLSGSFFGLQMSEWEWLGSLRGHLLTPDILFPLSITLGGIQVVFAMCINAFVTARSFGIKYALGQIGWIVILLSLVVGYFFDFAVPFLVMAGLGAVLMLFFNSPGKNPLVNFGAGLWNTYNNVSGLVGDLLSYIRLFAIGLSGGILAMVFNQLAVGMSGDIPVVKQLVMLLILLIGHGINLFMSCLSSFVHPLRLTFVEFYKNAGFEAANRTFKPLKK